MCMTAEQPRKWWGMDRTMMQNPAGGCKVHSSRLKICRRQSLISSLFSAVCFYTGGRHSLLQHLLSKKPFGTPWTLRQCFGARQQSPSGNSHLVRATSIIIIVYFPDCDGQIPFRWLSAICHPARENCSGPSSCRVPVARSGREQRVPSRSLRGYKTATAQRQVFLISVFTLDLASPGVPCLDDWCGSQPRFDDNQTWFSNGSPQTSRPPGAFSKVVLSVKDDFIQRHCNICKSIAVWLLWD